MHKVQMNSSEQVRVVGTVTIYSDFVDFKKSVSEQLLQNVVGSRAKLKFKWLSDNKVEVRTTCSAAEAHKIELLIESCDVTKMVAWSASANSNRKVRDKVMRKVQMNSSASCDDYVKLSTETLKRKLKTATPEEKKCIQAELNARGVYSTRSFNSAETSSDSYVDVDGILGSRGDIWTIAELADYWTREQANDPILSEYATYEDWLEDTLTMMRPVNSSRRKKLNSSVESQVWYHVSPDPIDSFDVAVSKEIGLHCGITPESGLCRHPNGYIYEVTVTPGIRCAELPDEIEFWSSFEIPRLLQKAGYANDKDVQNLTAKLQAAAGDSDKNRKYSKIIRDYLLSLGYSAFTYTNTKEVKERCICIFDFAAIQDMRDVTADYNSHTKLESQFYAPTDAAIFFHDAGYSDEQAERKLKSDGYSDRWIQRVLEVMCELASAESNDTLNSSIRTNSNRKVGNSSMRKVIFRGKLNSSRKRMNSSRKRLNSSLVDTFLQYHDDEENYKHQDMNYDKLYDMLNAYAKPGENPEDMDVDKLFVRAPETEQRAMIALIDPENWCEDFDSSRKRMNSSRSKRLNSSKKSEIMELTGWSHDDLADAFDQWIYDGGGEYEEDEQFDRFADAVAKSVGRGDTEDYFGIPLKASRRKRLNSSEDDVTADDDVQDTGIDGGDTATETAKLLDDALIVQNPETKEVSLFVATEDDEVLPESVDVIAEVTPVVEGAVLDSSRRLKRFTTAKLNSSKGCLNSDSDVCPGCGKPADECTCEPGTVAYDEIQLPDATVVEVENILVVQGEDDDLGLFMPETADDAVPEDYEVVAVATPVAEVEVLDSSRRLKKAGKKLNR